jgi:hypothetical protein
LLKHRSSASDDPFLNDECKVEVILQQASHRPGDGYLQIKLI